MKVKGVHTIRQVVEVDIDDEEISDLVSKQPVKVLVSALKDKLLKDFVSNLTPEFKGKRFIRISKGELYLFNADVDWDYHNRVGIDECVRKLTPEEKIVYQYITKLETKVLNLNPGLED